MPTLSYSIVPDGLLLPVMVWLDHPTMTVLAGAGVQLPRPMTVTALIDTGTDQSCISPAVVAQIKLTSTGRTKTTTAAGPSVGDLYNVSLGLTQTVGMTAPILLYHTLEVMGLGFQLTAIDVLIGMDVLRDRRLLIDGPARTFTLDC